MRRITILALLLLLAGALAVPATGALAQPSGAAAATAAASAGADFDNDGFADLAVGVPGESIDSIAGAGEVNVLYGTAARADRHRQPRPSPRTRPAAATAEAGDSFGFGGGRRRLRQRRLRRPGSRRARPEDVGATAAPARSTCCYGSRPRPRRRRAASCVTQDTPTWSAPTSRAISSASPWPPATSTTTASPTWPLGAPRRERRCRSRTPARCSVLYGSAGGLTATGGQLFTQVGGAVETGDAFGSACGRRPATSTRTGSPTWPSGRPARMSAVPSAPGR